jgi:hyperpolarization activated cyclic nucleotide-gated potassium channel 2
MSYRIGWSVEPSLVTAWVDYSIDIMFLIDITIFFNTAYFDTKTEQYIFSYMKIFQQYMKFWFWIDLISTIPFESIFYSTMKISVGGQYNQLVKILRIIRFARLSKVFSSRNKNNRDLVVNQPIIRNILLLVVQIAFVAHLFACIWHYITLGVDKSWVTEFDFQDSPPFDSYVASLYFIVMTTVTVGYGDIHAINNRERCFAIITMFTGGILFSALLSKITSLLEKRNPRSKALREKMAELREYLESIDLPLKLKNDAKVYILLHIIF